MTNAALDGVPLAPAATYRVTANGYLAGGGDGFSVLAGGRDKTTGVVDVDAFEAYFKAHSPISPPVLSRIAR